MKFETTFLSNQVPEWRNSYVDYNGLKNLIGTHDVDERFRSTIDYEATKVEEFYVDKYTSLSGAVAAFYQLYQLDQNSFLPDLRRIADLGEVDIVIDALAELYLFTAKLVWYGKLNFHGLQRILHKAETRIRNGNEFDSRRLLSRLQFARQEQTLTTLRSLEIRLSVLRGVPKTSWTLPYGFFVLYGLFQRHPDLFKDVSSISEAFYSRSIDSVSEIVDRILDEPGFDCERHMTSFVLAMVHVAIACGFSACIAPLLSRLQSCTLDGCPEHINFVHELCIRRRTYHLKDILDHMPASLQPYVFSKDRFGCTPLHYAAKQGDDKSIRVLLDRAQLWHSQRNISTLPESSQPDVFGATPLSLAVAGGFTQVCKLLLDHGRWSADREHRLRELEDLLALALLCNDINIVKCLLVHSKECLSNLQLESLLLLASTRRTVEGVRALLRIARPSIDKWNALVEACKRGHLSIVEMLLEAGADTRRTGRTGWTVIDHAAYRGWVDVTDLLLKHSKTSIPHTSDRPDLPLGEKSDINGYSKRIAVTPASFGRRAPDDAGQILIFLGSHDTGRNIKPVEFNDKCLSSECIDSFVEIYAMDQPDKRHRFSLPLLDERINQPAMFNAPNASNVHLAFRLYRVKNFVTQAADLIGSGVALIQNMRHVLRPQNDSLIRDHTVPILSSEGDRCIANVTFNALTIRPFEFRGPIPMPNEDAWKMTDAFRVMGHRGLGENRNLSRFLQLGENTLQSFRSAISQGATWLEFDVQVTKDGVPVVYHDFVVNETGTDTAMHTITYEQFMHISRSQSGLKIGLASAHNSAKPGTRPRAQSCDVNTTISSPVLERLETTHQFQIKGFKGNTRGFSVHDAFVTLEQTLLSIDPAVRFNIEIKYPMLFEADHFGLDHYAMEVNLFVDSILSVLFRLAKNRPIILSSFSPEICIALAIKRHPFPVFFLTDAGTVTVRDARAHSLQDAIHFVRAWNLCGIVTESRPVICAPKLVQRVKAEGFPCASYGPWNNDVGNVKVQMDAGLDAIIVDHVGMVNKALGK